MLNQHSRITERRQAIGFAGLFLVIVFGVLTARDAHHYSLEQRERVVQENVRLTREIQTNMNRLLEAFKQLDDVSMSCDQNVLRAFREQQFELIFVGEFGLSSRSGKLICTSWQKLTDEIDVQRPPKPGQVRIYGPIITKYLGKSALVFSKGRSDGNEINALVPMQWFRNALSSFDHDDGYEALIHTDAGTPIVINGDYSLPLGGGIDFPLQQSQIYEGLVDRMEQQFLSIQKVENWPLAIINSRSVAALDKGRIQLKLSNFVIALGISLLVFFSLWRVERQGASLRHQMQQGILNNEFINHYQPIVDARTNQMAGLEVLVRWKHPVDGLIPPGMFIPEAERSGLIIPMTVNILDNAISELSSLLFGHPKLKVNINICGQHLLDREFIAKVVAAREFLPNLMLELTENEIVAYQEERVIEAINELRAADIGLAIDDFGTGYSGLQYLSELPIDCIKIDRAFVAACGTDSPPAVVLETVANMAAKLKKSTVAEGVETEDQARYLISKQLYLHQGWLYAKAMPIEDLIAYLREKNKSGIPALTFSRD